MEKTYQTLRYLTKSLSAGIGIEFLVILGTVAVTDLVYHLTAQYNLAQPVVSLTVPFELASGLFALLIGMVRFVTDFKVTLANGISRKTYHLANFPAAILVAAALSIFNLVVERVHSLFWPINSYSELVYPRIGWIETIVFPFALYLLMITAGRFIRLAYYRSTTPVKWAISLAPLACYGLLRVVDAHFNGAIFRAIGEYNRWSQVLPRAIAIILAYALIIYALTYLLLRRTPLKA